MDSNIIRNNIHDEIMGLIKKRKNLLSVME